MFGEVGVGVTDERERLLVDDVPVEDVHLVLSHRLLQQNTSRRRHEQLASRQAGVDTSRYQLPKPQQKSLQAVLIYLWLH